MSTSIPNIAIREVSDFEGQVVQLQGWIYNSRSSGKIQFLQLRDGSAIIQCVNVKAEVDPEVFETGASLTQESSVRIIGEVRKDDRSPLGFELGVQGIELLHLAKDYPISPKEHGVAFLHDHRHLWLRSKRQHAILSIRNELIFAIRDYFYTQGFINLDAPIFTPNACEGTTTLFQTDYYGQPAFLTQSGQLYMEAGALAFGKAYCFGPTFRAEKSKTRRHLTEFWMVEPELAFADLEQDMNLAEDFLVSIVSRVLDRCQEHLKVLERDTSKLEMVQKPFPRVHYNDAIKVLKDLGQDIEWGGDFGAEDETKLTQQYDRPIIVHRFPSAIKAFYMREDPTDPKLSLSMDVLGPEGYGEIIGGGERETSLEVLEKKIEHDQLPKEAFQWYLDLRRYGSVPHAGFGLGLERAITWICGLHHVRETIPFPRMMERLTP
ncbi:MAG: asparagine--tRNA ligase [Bdellovibrionales bacterium]|nr:asparagine--tRNA ligase [Bdellovibrionales bacterium]